jgi:protease-4
MFKRLLRIIGLLNPLRAIGRLWFEFRNWRRGRFKKLDYILFPLPAKMSPLPESRGWLRQRLFGASPMSLWDLERHLQRIGDDPRPKGVILLLRGLNMTHANLQTLRNMILHLRERGKKVICYAQNYDNAAYYLASAADQMLIQPGGTLFIVGYALQVIFLKDALDTLGVALDVVAISPYKSAYEQFSRSDISPENRQQLDWILDSRYETFVNSIAEGRNSSPEAVRALIDGAPYLAEEALTLGYVDGVLNEEGFAAHLGVEHLVPWKEAEKKLLKKRKKQAEKYVAILPLSGTIITGESGKPPIEPPFPVPFLDSERLGDQTVVQQVRNLIKNERAAAVVLFVDSPGGSVNASEAMYAALTELAKTRPVVVYMNSVAASGGYYISMPAQWIVAQPGTITGSIVVISAKPVTGGLVSKLHANRVELLRGANASMLTDTEPFTDSQRARMMATVESLYRQFIKRVSSSRKLTDEAVDAVGGGRVWTGVQAKTHGLVDELGDVRAALKKARELANLPDDTPTVIVTDKGKPLAPQLAQQTNPAAAVTYLLDGLKLHFNALPQMLMDVFVSDKA